MLISQTYEIVTEESASHGEAEESGFIFKDQDLTFRELVELMEEHPECSSSHFQGVNDWFSSYSEQDYRTGAEKTTSIHFSRKNPARLHKYWIKAAKFAAGN